MRKRTKSKTVHDSETLTSKSISINPIKQEEEEGIEKKAEEQQKGFFACYLLTSLCPRYKGHTYVGFSVNPRRRIRQHNGEIRCGAFRTKKRRPWEMVLCIYGFPTNVSALQFEWAWQHPSESRAVRQAAATFKSFSGVANKIKLAYTMLNLPNWQSLNITVNYFSTKYSKLSSNCPSLPEHMKVQVRSMDELPCYTEGDESLFDDENGQGDEDCDEGSENCGSLPETYKDVATNFSSDYTLSSDEASYEQGSQLKKYGIEQPRDSSCLEVNWQQSFGLISSQDNTSSSSFLPVNLMEETNDMNWQQIDGNQQPCPIWKRSTAEVAMKDEKIIHLSATVQNVEVVDLLTPSPNCRIMSSGKKRKLSSFSPIIIDLT